MRLRLFTLRKPSKVKRPVGSPLMAKAERAAVGPGTTYTGSPAAAQAATRVSPGSEMAGIPASDTNAQVWPSCSRATISGPCSSLLCSK